MSINSDDESSFDLGGGVDLFIQDTQENMTSCGGAVQSEDDGGKAPSPHYPTYECTQVDNGEYSDEDDSVGGGDMYGATQVDDDYLRRMAESAELLDDVGDGNVSEQQDGESQVEDIAESRPSMGTVEMNEANVAERVSTEAPAAEACSTINTGASDAEHSDSDEEEDSDGNFVDFCIADTQQPPSRHSSVRNKQTSSNETNEVTTTNMMSLGVPAAEPVITANPDAEDTNLSVYDYLSAPLSNHDGKPEVNVFSALDAIPPPQYSTLYTAKTSNTVNSAAFATAQTGSIYVTHPVGKSAPHMNPGGVEEEPTQLDGSSVRLSGDSHSLGDHSSNRLSGSHSHGVSSHDTSERSAQSVLLSPELLLEPAVAVAAEVTVTVASPAVPVLVQVGATVTRAETEGEWLSVKNIKSHILPPIPPALIRQSPQKATAAATAPNTTTVSNANNVPNQTHAGESETQLSGLGFAENDSQALADALEEKSLEELVRMQEKLSRMINSKIQKTASPVVSAVPSPAATAAASAVLENKTAPVAPSVASSVAPSAAVAIAAPLERQQTSYGLSQPSNLAVSSLMLLKSTPGPVTIGSSSSDSGSVNANANESLTHREILSANGASPAGQRKFTTFSAGTAGLAAVTPAGSNISSSHGGVSTGSTTATRSPSPTGTDSSNKRFLKRKFGRPQGHAQALSAVAEDANLQFEMSEGSDSDVASPHSSGDERQGRKKAEKGSPSKHINKKHAGVAVKAVDKMDASPSVVVVNKSKVRRIVIEDTQDDHHDEHNNNDNNDDEDAEFTADYFVSSPQPVRSGAVPSSNSNNTNINSSNNSNSETNKAREALIAKALPADLPKSLLQNIPEKFVDLWHSLTDLGWFWKRGGGIVSYYYVRPNCLVKKGFLMGRDYFGDEQEVLKFVSKTVKEAKAALLKQGIDMNPPPPPPPPPKVKPMMASASASGVTTGNTATSTTINNASAGNNTQTADQQKIPTSRQLVPQFSTVSVTSGQLPPDDPIMSDIHRIPWKWLWKILRARDWSWDFGPGHSNFYFPPGYNIRSKNAILGEHKFNSEEGVRRYVRKQNWPQFSKGNEKQSQSGAESQLPDAYLNDPNWGLASHRRKRDVREARFGGDHNSTSDNESPDEATHGPGQKGASSRKKANKGNVSGASSKSGSAAPSKAQKNGYTSDLEETEQATQAQRMTQISPIKSNKMANQSRAPLIASSAAPSGQIFAENRFVVSGIPEKLKTQLIKDIVKLGGKILSSVPVDGNESRDTVVTDEKTGRAVRNGSIFVVSHPREFRKPNYLMALATGVTLVHFQWIVDCKDRSKRLPVEQYLLPSGCCALHAYNIFPTPRTSVVAVEKGSAGLGLGPALEPEGLMDGVKVLNLAGGSWDNLLLTVGAITVENEAPLLQTLQNLRTGGQAGGSASKSGRSSRPPVDVILVDPYEYALCASVSGKAKFSSSSSSSGGRYNTPHSLLAVGSAAKNKTAATSSTPKSPAAKLGEAELQVIQHCAALSSLESASVSGLSARTHHHQRQAPIVVTTDWLVHCIALDELLDHTLIDLFTLPPEPETRPFTYKADAVTSTGERYSKYDIVYYRSKVVPSAAHSVRNSPVKAPKASEVLLLGKIVGFVRRDEKSQLFARIRPLVSTSSAEAVSVRPDIVVPRGPATEKDLHAVRHKEVHGDPHNALCMIEVERLCGKAILLQKEDFLRVSKYSFSDESVYYVSKAWKEENPCVLDSGDGSESQESEDQDVFQMRIQRSQDY